MCTGGLDYFSAAWARAAGQRFICPDERSTAVRTGLERRGEKSAASFVAAAILDELQEELEAEKTGWPARRIRAARSSEIDPLDRWPAAWAAVSAVCWAGNAKHNPGQPLHHARGKSSDHADCVLRHWVERGGIDAETGMRHTAEAAWRALALDQEQAESEGAPLARGARLPEKPAEPTS